MFFSRSVSEGEGELEVYLALLTIDDGRGGGGRVAGRYSKVYARGRGVQRIEGSGGEWYLDGVFGGERDILFLFLSLAELSRVEKRRLTRHGGPNQQIMPRMDLQARWSRRLCSLFTAVS